MSICRCEKCVEHTYENFYDKDFVKGYTDDAGVDIILSKDLVIRTGFENYELPINYRPEDGEVAFLMFRGSSARLGLIMTPVAIDANYDGEMLNLPIFNASSETIRFTKGMRAFSIINFVKARDRVQPRVLKHGKRGTNRDGSSGG